MVGMDVQDSGDWMGAVVGFSPSPATGTKSMMCGRISRALGPSMTRIAITGLYVPTGGDAAQFRTKLAWEVHDTHTLHAGTFLDLGAVLKQL